ncbi:MAG: NAD-dependent epimerase/dehydratase family protein [Puniceicoccales bacterium]|jgi:UDP-glucose 4-epimerase|nr:NAD-dependent epimerase/dehydratase family protein [Puniceicoccales bacterium]
MACRPFQKRQRGLVRALVVGGGGYLGSHIVHGLLAANHGVVVVDNFFSGHRELLPRQIPIFSCDAGYMAGVEDVLGQHPVDVVIYCAGLSDSARSRQYPFHYYHNNFIAVFYLLQAMLRKNVRRFLFSSNFSIHGPEPAVPITERSPRQPEDPLGRSLCAVEDLLADLAISEKLGYAVVRVGNVAGALPSGKLGPWPSGSNRLIAMALDVAQGLREFLPVHGEGLPTVDGSPVRDHVHVCDVVEAYLSAAARIPATGGGDCYLLGTGRPASVIQVAKRVEALTHRPIALRVTPGDWRPWAVHADATRTRRELAWAPRHDLDSIVETEWRWRMDGARQLAAVAGKD